MNLINTLPRSIAVNPLAIIDRIIFELELRPEMHKDATASYEAVAAVLDSLNFKIECRQIKFSSGYPFCAEGVERFLEFGEGTRQG